MVKLGYQKVEEHFLENQMKMEILKLRILMIFICYILQT